MPTSADSLETYEKVWNERDSSKRAQLLQECTMADLRYVEKDADTLAGMPSLIILQVSKRRLYRENTAPLPSILAMHGHRGSKLQATTQRFSTAPSL